MKTQQIVINSLLASFSVFLAILCRAFTVSGIPFLKFDIADVPVFAATLVFGFPSGFAILFTASFVRALFFSTAGWTGFIMRITSVVVILFLEIYRKKRKFLILILIATIITYLIIKIPISYVFWTYFHGVSPVVLKSAILPIIIPFNLIKTLINILLALVFEKFLKSKV
ncbi:MAG: ECF transporter S component [Oscillospiraceae bacterium]|nr:ECF transporter S component [Oscillospiraceae bacterium]